jgi:parallel beta helix pectate lyase-like protein
MDQPIVVTVGPKQADLVGRDNLVLQAAVDRVAAAGGGVVQILPGTYTMHDSLHLRSGVRVRGSGKRTVLKKALCVTSRLSADLGYGHFDVSLAQPDKFRPGMGVHIRDDRSGGFYGTVATLTWREGDRFGTSRMLNHDYARHANAIVRSVFPVVSGYHLGHVTIENLAIDGNGKANELLDGCRGGGIFLLQAHDVLIRNVTVRQYNGDGISFQQCRRTHIEDCLVEENTGCGLHPGSGSVAPIMRRVTSRHNGADGIFYCLRVSYSLTEDCVVTDNGHDGVSIGGRDTDHLIRANRIEGNARHGVYWRPGDLAMAGHRCLLEANTIAGNGAAQIHIDGDARDIHILGNTIRSAGVGLAVASARARVVFHANDVTAKRPIAYTKGAKAKSVRTTAPATPLAVGPDARPHTGFVHLGVRWST